MNMTRRANRGWVNSRWPYWVNSCWPLTAPRSDLAWTESSWSAQGRRRNAATSFAKASGYWKRKPCAESG